jgi:hypothetical protein
MTWTGRRQHQHERRRAGPQLLHLPFDVRRRTERAPVTARGRRQLILRPGRPDREVVTCHRGTAVQLPPQRLQPDRTVRRRPVIRRQHRRREPLLQPPPRVGKGEIFGAVRRRGLGGRSIGLVSGQFLVPRLTEGRPGCGGRGRGGIEIAQTRQVEGIDQLLVADAVRGTQFLVDPRVHPRGSVVEGPGQPVAADPRQVGGPENLEHRQTRRVRLAGQDIRHQPCHERLQEQRPVAFGEPQLSIRKHQPHRKFEWLIA